MIEIDEIKKMLPHRYPFLLVDRVLELVTKQKVVALKNVTVNENFFNGHFPAKPVMPGVLIIESMAQAAGLAMLSQDDCKGRIPYLTGIDNARFRRAVVPGDQIIIEIDVIRMKGTVARVKAVAKVDNQVATEAELMFMLAE
ncbi:MAG TPA: 3-hydroxyacyl-ACP dehydratase FabZ [Bacillota bacterium]|nr:3-hydroxyacyl-ACP dehydratase FabZ [Bacillota bacterium]